VFIWDLEKHYRGGNGVPNMELKRGWEAKPSRRKSVQRPFQVVDTAIQAPSERFAAPSEVEVWKGQLMGETGSEEMHMKGGEVEEIRKK